MPKGIVWTAVVSALAGAACIVLAFMSNNTMANAFGFVSVASALLATRER
jgi:nicotinamide riboside transporter PnuC